MRDVLSGSGLIGPVSQITTSRVCAHIENACYSDRLRQMTKSSVGWKFADSFSVLFGLSDLAPVDVFCMCIP